jgi:PAS domain S-box-containing protein
MTRRKAAAAELVYHAHLLENMEDAVLATDGSFVLTAWNQGAQTMFGWTAEEALGRVVHELIPASWDADGLAEQLRALRSTGRWRGEAVFYAKDGSAVHAEALTVPVDGSIAGYLCIMRDVGEVRRVEIDQERLAAIVRNTSEFAGIADLEGRVIFVNPAGQDLVGLRGMEAVRETRVVDYFHPDDRDYVRDVALPAVVQDGRWTQERELRFRHFETGAAIPVRWDAFRIDNPRTGEPMGLATVTTDLTRQKRIEDTLRRRTDQQAVLAELGLRALAVDDVEALMDDAVELLARTLGVELAKVTEVLPGGELIVRAGVGWQPGVVGSRTELAGRSSQAGYTLVTGSPTVTFDPVTEKRFEPSDLVREHKAQSAVCVVIHAGDEPFGVLGAITTQLREFSEYDVSFVQSIANVLATAVERSRIQRDLRGALEAERRRIARDLHDGALPDLAHALAGALHVKTATSDRPSADSLGELVAALKRVGQQVRGAIYDLRLADAKDRPFIERIEALVERHRELTDFKIELQVSPQAPPGPGGPRGTEAVQILAEALTNARRHSEVQAARVTLWGSSHQLCVEVVDEGCGFDPRAAGAGLAGMRERAGILGGRLSLETSPGEGTRVTLELPLSPPAGTEDEDLRVLLVEDHAAVREAIASAFASEPGIRVVGQAASLAEARSMLERVDVAVVDLGLPDGYGGDFIRELSEVNPRAQALVLSASLDRADVARAVESGAAGVLNKNAHLDEVVSTVRRLWAGETLLPMDEVVELLSYAARRREQERDDRNALSRLTPRELEVLQLMADGLDSRTIAENLHISVRTQRNHVANILSKLGVHSQLQALVFALRYDAVRIPSAGD